MSRSPTSPKLRNQAPNPQRNQAMQTATTLKPMPSATTPSPALQLTARRLVHLRSYPFNKANGQELTASEAFEYALRVVLDEHGLAPGTQAWYALFYGKSQSCVNDMPDGWV